MKKNHPLDGQLSIFDFPKFLPEEKTDVFQTMTIERAAEIIGNRTGLKFILDERFNKNKESYSTKKKGLEVTIEFANYASGVRGGIRHLGVDYSFKKQGGARPCESIDEAVEYIQEKIDSLISAAVPFKECMNPPVEEPIKMVYTGEIIKDGAVAVFVCAHSNHKCNKEKLWKVAESFTDIECQKVCCRQCHIRLCGARCNGSEEPKQKIINDYEWHSINTPQQH